jgi:hypothetical protein
MLQMKSSEAVVRIACAQRNAPGAEFFTRVSLSDD